MEQDFISIIIPLYNDEKYIKICLEHIFALEFLKEKYEVIIVDNGSTDNGIGIAEQYPVTIISCPDGNISKVRNTGAKASSGNILAFVDSDCAIDSKWLVNGKQILENKNVAAVGGGYTPPEDACWIPKAWYIENKKKMRSVNFLPAGNFLVKKDAFNEVNGFDESLITCEDSDICERIVKKNHLIFLSSEMVCIHMKNPEKISEFFKKEIWYSLGMLSSIKNGLFDKVLFLTVIFYFFHALLFLTPLSIGFLFFSVGGVFVILNLATFYRLFLSKKYHYYGHLLFLYYLYFLARGIGTIKAIIGTNK